MTSDFPIKKYPSYEDWEQSEIDDLVFFKGKIFAEAYNRGLDPADFAEKFQCGPIAGEWDDRDKPEYTYWHWTQSVPAFEGELYRKYGIELKKLDPGEYYEKLDCCANELDPDIIEWVGRIYETWSRHSGMSSKEVYGKLDFFDMYAAWDSGHYDDEFTFVQMIDANPDGYKLGYAGEDRDLHIRMAIEKYKKEHGMENK